jgi:pimeloyl-ACP methyl ester carboxylesterase
VVLRLSYRAILHRPEASGSSLASVGSTGARTGRSGAFKLENAASQIGGGFLVYTWTDEYAHLSGPGQREIQADLLYDYRTNVESYPAWQAWLREHRPPALVVWGRNDPSFIAPGAAAFERDLPDAEIHLLDAGHFALDEKNDEIASLILAFLAKHSL